MKLSKLVSIIIIILVIAFYNEPESYSIILDTKKQILPKYIKEIHTIDINKKIIPKQLFLKKQSLVRWINKTNQPQKIICIDLNDKIVFESKVLNRDEFDTYIFNDIGQFNYYSVNDDININTIFIS